jgi:hypothetical protein
MMRLRLGTTDRVARVLFVASVTWLLFGSGVVMGWFCPVLPKIAANVADTSRELAIRCKLIYPKYYRKLKPPYPRAVFKTKQAYHGLNLVVGIGPDRVFQVKLMKMDGTVIRRWDVDWFKIWPDAKHVPNRAMPQSRPGVCVHDAILLRDGDLVFNFGGLGLVRLDSRGRVVWRLPCLVHHLMGIGNDGNLWVCEHINHRQASDRFPQRVPPFYEDTILKVTLDGEVLREWHIADILRKNGLTGMLYMDGLGQMSTQASGDFLHLNDVEEFPAHFKEGFFKKGDIMVSLRNINTVIVFNPESEKIRFVSTGVCSRQHDPDFIDGNTISIFDNNRACSSKSRIVVVSAPDNRVETYYQGTSMRPFYSAEMGNHQWLPNGNLLITESAKGRSFEINRKGKIVWQYYNYVANDVVGSLCIVRRLPHDYLEASDAPRMQGSLSCQSATLSKSDQPLGRVGDQPLLLLRVEAAAHGHRLY